MSRSTFLVLLVLLLVHKGSAQQDQIPFEKYGVQEGLPEERVAYVLQDDQGYIWCLTQQGTVRFDGHQFQRVEVWNPAQKDAKSLLFYDESLIKGTDGDLWMSGNFTYGFGVYSPQLHTIKEYHHLQDQNGKDLYSICSILFEDASQNIWFDNRSYEHDTTYLCRFNKDEEKVYRYPQPGGGGKISDLILNYNIAESPTDSTIWLSSLENNDLLRLNKEMDKFEVIIPQGTTIPGTNLKDTLSDVVPVGKSGLLILSSRYHVFLWDPIQLKAVKYFKFTQDRATSWSAFEDNKGNVWVSTPNKILRYSIEQDVLEDFSVGEGELSLVELPSEVQRIHPSYESSSDLWFSVNALFRTAAWTAHAFLRYSYEEDKFYGYNSSFNFKDNQKGIVQSPHTFFEDFSGIKWYGTRPNLYREDKKRGRMDLFRSGPKPTDLPSDTITYVLEDSKKRLWIGTSKGLALYHDDAKTFERFTHSSIKASTISGNLVRQIFEDHLGQIWVGTESGLSLFREAKRDFQRIESKKIASFISSITQDQKGQIWVSSMLEGVFVLNTAGQILQALSEPTSSDSTALTSNLILDVLQHSNGETWLGDVTTEKGIFRYDPSSGEFELFNFKTGNGNQSHYITEDKNGNVWFGTDEQISIFDYNTHQFIDFGSAEDNFYSQTSFAIDPEGNFWTGTYGGAGLVSVSAESGTHQVYGEKEGLLHNGILNFGREIPIDTFGNLYLGTYRGLSLFNTKSKTFHNFGESDGFQKSNGMYTGLARENGEVWIGGENGLNRIDPKKLFAQNMVPPNVWITSISILDSVYSSADSLLFTNSVSYTDTLELTYDQKDLSFDFVALHYLRPDENQYSWKLEGYDDDWTEPSPTRKASYTNLSPGSYTFRVKGSNADGIWSETGDFIEIIIHPPFWLTRAAFLFYGLIFIASMYGVHRTQKARTVHKERERIREEKLEHAKEIEKAYKDLKHTQQQLIQSEKMASLGELTAGIAHEIQNPLNFVNNFSDLNKEMLEELSEAVASNDQKEVLSIIRDLTENEVKINHHGKRAEEIVRSMLQHSRNSSGEKELTDLNMLADEYLRLAYHGLRAKDKSFNAEFKAELDPTLPKISVVPQDIGRVLLNLINNAFQAVKEVEKPEVVVTTKHMAANASGDSKIQITVSDNGPGVSEHIRDKIYQPFFTTKITGQGTGLGLSMSYEIITKGHKGKIDLISKPGKGAAFIITLPLK